MTEDELRKQAWDFFQMQASQRLTTFNFYIAISSVICTGLAASFRSDINIPHLSEILGFFLIAFSFVFFKLDERNRDLIKGAEETLKYFESKANIDVEASDAPHVAKRFTREEYDTKAKKNQRSLFFWRNHYSYSDCFRMVFLSFGGVGLIGVAYSLLHHLQ
jgi:hypothetical protein